MWALAPAGARIGLVIDGGGLAALEATVNRHGAALVALPALADSLAGLPELPLRSPIKLAELGLAAQRPAAVFFVGDDDAVMALPVRDREKLRRQLRGRADGGWDRLGAWSCKPASGVYVCATSERLLGALGKGDLGRHAALAGVRGEVELIAEIAAPGAATPVVVAAAAQLERGAVTVRGAIANLSNEARRPFSAAAKPRVVAERSVGLGVYDPRPLLKELPDLPLLPGVTSGALARSVAGPLSIAWLAGEMRFDAQVPLSDAAPFTSLVQRCTELPELGVLLKAERGACRFDVPDASPPMSIELWIEGKTLHLGARAAAAPPGSRAGAKAEARMKLTAFGEELAQREWALAVWGRGAPLSPWPFPRERDPRREELGQKLRIASYDLLKLLSELGVGVRLDGDVLRFAAHARTIFANPDDVIAKLLTISGADIDAGRGVARAEAIARGAPGAPFAADHVAGAGGLILPVVILAGVGAPLLTELTSQRARKSEAELMLGELWHNAELHYRAKGKFPVGKVGLTPRTSCCSQNAERRRKCAVSPRLWASSVWRALELAPEKPHYFQYSYESDGEKLLAQAVGDLDCDGNVITWYLIGTVEQGSPRMTLTPPPPNSD
jgi:hypothetical protein